MAMIHEDMIIDDKPAGRMPRGLYAGLGVGAVLLLAGCGSMQGGANSCGKDRLAGYVGRSVENLPELSGVTRVIGPDMMVTQDYWPTRLNVDVNKAGTITRVWCG